MDRRRPDRMVGAIGSGGGGGGIRGGGGGGGGNGFSASAIRNGGSNSNIQVAVRLRPLSQAEKSSGRAPALITDADRGLVAVRSCGEGVEQPKVFQFDKVFDHSASQRDVFEAVARPVVERALQGFNGAIIAYGQTGTGKTYTMEGLLGDEKHMGIIPGICRHIFEATAVGDKKADEERTYSSLHVNYIEIYNEELRDLLSERKDRIALRELAGGRLILGRDYKVESMEDITRLLQRGKANRAVAMTRSNESSSRSHAVFLLYYAAMITGPTGPETKGRTRRVHSTLQLVDLAGSERHESQTNSEGTRLRESRKINKSLTALGLVIAALAERKRHVPYRDSKLTRLLQDSLGGNSKTVIIATVSPSEAHRRETMCTLRYATGARDVTNVVVRNESEMRLAAAAAAMDEQLSKCMGMMSCKNGGSRGSSRPSLRTTKVRERLGDIVVCFSNTDFKNSGESEGGGGNRASARRGRSGAVREDTYVRVGGRAVGGSSKIPVPPPHPRSVRSTPSAKTDGSGRRQSGGEDVATSDADTLCLSRARENGPEDGDYGAQGIGRFIAPSTMLAARVAKIHRSTQTSPKYTGIKVPPLNVVLNGGRTQPSSTWNMPSVSAPTTCSAQTAAAATTVAATAAALAQHSWPTVPLAASATTTKLFASSSLPSLVLADRRLPWWEEEMDGLSAGDRDSPSSLAASSEGNLCSSQLDITLPIEEIEKSATMSTSEFSLPSKEKRRRISEGDLDDCLVRLLEVRKVETIPHGDGRGGGEKEEGGEQSRDLRGGEFRVGGGDGKKEARCDWTSGRGPKWKTSKHHEVAHRCPSCHLPCGGDDELKRDISEWVPPRSTAKEVPGSRSLNELVALSQSSTLPSGHHHVQEPSTPRHQLKTLNEGKKVITQLPTGEMVSAKTFQLQVRGFEEEPVPPFSVRQEVPGWGPRNGLETFSECSTIPPSHRHLEEPCIPYHQLEALQNVKKGVFSCLDTLESEVQSIYQKLGRCCALHNRSKPLAAAAAGRRGDGGGGCTSVAALVAMPHTATGSLADIREMRIAGEDWWEQGREQNPPQDFRFLGLRAGSSTTSSMPSAATAHSAARTASCPSHSGRRGGRSEGSPTTYNPLTDRRGHRPVAPGWSLREHPRQAAATPAGTHNLH